MKKNFALGYCQVISWCTAWAILTFVNAGGANIYINAICEEYDISAALLLDAATYGGWIGGVLFLAVPLIIRRAGAKRLLVGAVITGGFVFAGLPLSGNTVVMQLGMMLTGVCAGFYGISAPMVLVSKWFPRKKGLIMGIISAGAIGASVVFIPLFNYMIGAFGIKLAMASFGIFMAAYGFVNVFLLRETPEECGLLPDNMEMTEEEKARFSINGKPTIGYRQALAEKRLWFIAFGWGFLLIALLGFTFIAVSYMLERGVGNNTAIMAVAVCGIIQFFVSLLSGAMDQKTGPVKTAVFFFLFQITGMGLVVFYSGGSDTVVLLSYWLVLGTFGTANNLASSHNLTVFGTANYPLTYNCQAFATSILKMMGTFIAARSLVWVGDYSLAYIAFGIALILGITCIILGGDKPLQERWKGGTHA